jgi:hypothetical protein
MKSIKHIEALCEEFKEWKLLRKGNIAEFYNDGHELGV